MYFNIQKYDDFISVNIHFMVIIFVIFCVHILTFGEICL